MDKGAWCSTVHGFAESDMTEQLSLSRHWGHDKYHYFMSVVLLWRRKWQLTPVSLPEKSHGQRSLVGFGPWGCEELDITEHTEALFVKHL